MGPRVAVLFAGAAALALLLTPRVRALAVRLGAVDRGTTRVPRLGGVALFAAAAGALCLAEAAGFGIAAELSAAGWALDWLAAGAATMLLLGVVDDVVTLGPATKLAGQTLAAVIAVQGGYGITALTNPLTGGVVWLGALGPLLAVAWIVAVSNAFNLIDGLDGLAAGTGLIAAGTLFLVALAEQRPDAALMASALAGALAGFLRFNFAPASIHLGDAGSLLLGYLLSVLSIQALQKGPTAVIVLVPILALGLPILETAVTIGRRTLVHGLASVVRADREHIHHRLLALGMTERRAVLVLYAVCLAFGGLAFLAMSARGPGNVALVGGVAVAAWLALRRLGYRRRR